MDTLKGGVISIVTKQRRVNVWNYSRTNPDILSDRWNRKTDSKKTAFFLVAI